MKILIVFTLFLTCLTVMGQNFDSEFKYTDTINKGVTIQNSFPKGGLKYITPTGEEYVYTIFWTRITNKTASTLEFTINFPVDAFTVPSSFDTKFQLYLPTEEMTLKKDPLFNYGLDLKSFLDESVNKSSSLQRTINSKNSFLFYVVALYSQGINGVVRARLELHEQDLYYKITGNKIYCGRIVAKN